jgi:ABC-type multidrug transport system fused ATPase/permease subunit
MAPHRRILVPGLACAALVSACNLANFWLLKQIGDTMQGVSRLPLSLIGLLIVGVFVARATFSFGQLFLVSDAIQKMTRDIRNAVFAHVQSLPLRFFENRRTGQLMASITSDVPVISESFQSGVIESITAPIMVLGTIVTMVNHMMGQARSRSLSASNLAATANATIPTATPPSCRIRKYAPDPCSFTATKALAL